MEQGANRNEDQVRAEGRRGQAALREGHDPIQEQEGKCSLLNTQQRQDINIIIHTYILTNNNKTFLETRSRILLLTILSKTFTNTHYSFSFLTSFLLKLTLQVILFCFCFVNCCFCFLYRRQQRQRQTATTTTKMTTMKTSRKVMSLCVGL